MRTEFRILMAGALLLDLLLITLVAYLAFIFPRTMALWAESATELATGQMWLANASAFCAAYGFILIPVLMLGSFGTVALFLLTLKRS